MEIPSYGTWDVVIGYVMYYPGMTCWEADEGRTEESKRRVVEKYYYSWYLGSMSLYIRTEIFLRALFFRLRCHPVAGREREFSELMRLLSVFVDCIPQYLLFEKLTINQHWGGIKLCKLRLAVLLGPISDRRELSFSTMLAAQKSHCDTKVIRLIFICDHGAPRISVRMYIRRRWVVSTASE